MRVLVIDNYDSFVYTLDGYLQQLGAETTVVRNDVVDASEVPQLIADYDAVLVSPSSSPVRPGPTKHRAGRAGETRPRSRDQLKRCPVRQASHEARRSYSAIVSPCRLAWSESRARRASGSAASGPHRLG